MMIVPLAAVVQDADMAITHLREFLRFPTVSQSQAEDHVTDSEVFTNARRYLEETYSGLLQAPGMQYHIIARHSMLLEWRGTDPNLKPVMLYGHYAVVPVGNGTEVWEHDPFSADLHDGCVQSVHRIPRQGLTLI